jgi:hypothetical protein
MLRSLPGDRRSRQRIDVHLPVAYTAGELSGTGRVRDISYDGICFTAPAALPAGAPITLTLHVPATDGVAPVQLVLKGTLVRSSGNEAAARISSRSFRAAQKALAAGMA